MSETTPSSVEHQSERHILSTEDAASLVTTDEQAKIEIKGFAKAETEVPDPRVPSVMCTPLLTEGQFLKLTAEAKAIIVVAYASGAMPDRLAPAIKQRIQEGIPVMVLSNNPGDQAGIIKFDYAAGKEAYDAGAVPLEKVNINQQGEVMAAIIEALNQGLRGQALAEAIRQRYAYGEGETKPLAEWDRPGYIPPHLRNT